MDYAAVFERRRSWPTEPSVLPGTAVVAADGGLHLPVHRRDGQSPRIPLHVWLPDSMKPTPISR